MKGGLALAGAFVAILALAPMVPLVLWSVARGWRFPALLPNAFSTDPWAHALSPVSGVPAGLAASALVAALAAVLSVAIGLPAARALALGRGGGRGWLAVLVLAPLVVPGIAVGLGLQAVFLHLGLTGTLAGVVLAHLVPTLPYAILMLAAVMAGFDTDIEAQARTLGATRWGAFRHVTLPLVLPGVLVAACLAFLVSWGQYLLTLLIGGGKVATLPLTLYSAVAAGRHDLAGAIALLAVIPCALVLAVTGGRIGGRTGERTGSGDPRRLPAGGAPP